MLRIFGRQSAQRRVEGLAEVLLVQPPRGVVVAGGLGERTHAVTEIQGWPALAPPPPVQGRVRDDPQEPVPEPAPAVEIRQTRERLQQCLLDHIHRILLVPQQPVSHPVGVPAIALEQLFACARIPLPGALHQDLVGRLHAGGSLEHTFP